MLDFDGVLHRAQTGTLRRLPALEAWLREFPQVDVVISSNWRDTHALPDLCAYFSADLQPRVIGTTPNIEGARREDEILALVREYGITCWAALDDQPEGFPRTAETNLAATEYYDGLTNLSLRRLSLLLCGVNDAVANV
jgi:hypothetical protein